MAGTDTVCNIGSQRGTLDNVTTTGIAHIYLFTTAVGIWSKISGAILSTTTESSYWPHQQRRHQDSITNLQLTEKHRRIQAGSRHCLITLACWITPRRQSLSSSLGTVASTGVLKFTEMVTGWNGPASSSVSSGR